jgi:3-carboxy-cis,cis-muconate cycloisomerase
MASHIIDYELFGDQFSTPEMRAIFDERTMLQRWLDVETALAAAQAELGLIPAEAAETIARAARVDGLDLAAMKADLKTTAHPIVPLVRELAKRCGEAGRWVHWGATTQDIMDTGMILQLKDAHAILRRDLRALVRGLADLAVAHRTTIMAGRTHAQQALPITFGFKVAVWVAETLRHLERLEQIRPRLLVGELAGAVGTLAGFGADGMAVQAIALRRLGLGIPSIAWHVARDAVSEWVTLLALLAGTCARIANEVIQLQRSEIAELEEPFAHGKVGSSTMPHKRNPAHAERVVAIGRLVRGLATTALETMVVAHERDQSATRAEWVLVSEATCLAAASLSATLFIARGLRVDPARMRANIDDLGGLIMSEAVMLELGRAIGRNTAHDVVYEAAMAAFEGRGTFTELLATDPRVKGALSEADLAALMRPESYTGLAAQFVDGMVAEVRRTIG